MMYKMYVKLKNKDKKEKYYVGNKKPKENVWFSYCCG